MIINNNEEYIYALFFLVQELNLSEGNRVLNPYIRTYPETNSNLKLPSLKSNITVTQIQQT